MPRVETRVPRGRRASIRLVNVTDFTGGLNLSREQFRIAENESPDLLNVDIGARGGFTLRKTVTPYNSTALSDDPRSIWSYANSGGTTQLLVNVGDDVLSASAGTFTSLGLAGATTGPFRAVTFNDLCYIQRNAEQVPVKWDGSTDTNLTASDPTWQDDLASPTGGYMPKAKCIAAHGGYVWVANTVENGTAHPNRVRWSHPGRPEDWRENDYIDIDIGHDGDVIVALVPYSDHLLVFKANSIHAIFGYDPDSFQEVTVDLSRGTLHQDSVVATPMGVFFFSWPEGVYLYDGKKGGRWIFDKLYPAVVEGDVPAAYKDEIMLGYGNSRLWVTVPWEDATTRDRTFVYDPRVGKDGAWTCYDLATGPYVEVNINGTFGFYGGAVGTDRVLALDQTGAAQDNLGAGAVDIESYFTTAWFDDNQPAVRKRWKRVEAVLHHEGSELVVPARVYRDWDPTNWIKEFTFDVAATDNMLWDSGVWDSDEWAVEGDVNVIDRGSNVGSARAVSLRLTGPTGIQWGVEALIFKYFPRTLRS